MVVTKKPFDGSIPLLATLCEMPCW